MACKRRKNRKLMVIEFGGADWYGQIYENKDGSWSWILGVDLGLRCRFNGQHGFTSRAWAYQSMKSRLAAIVEDYYSEVDRRLNDVFRQPVK